MSKTINELLEEFNDPPFTKEDYLKEKAELELLIFEKYGIKAEDIDAAMKEHKIPHSCGSGDLVDRWVENEAFLPYLDSGDEDTQDCIPAVKV